MRVVFVCFEYDLCKVSVCILTEKIFDVNCKYSILPEGLIDDYIMKVNRLQVAFISYSRCVLVRAIKGFRRIEIYT